MTDYLPIHEYNVRVTFVGLIRSVSEEEAIRQMVNEIVHLTSGRFDVYETDAFHSETCTVQPEEGP